MVSDRSVQNALLALWSVMLFTGCLLLHTRHQDFPYHYHPDEPGKVEQVISGKWNFHHPMLLLSTTKVAMAISPAPYSPQHVVETGRLVSAIFTAVAVVAFSLLAYIWRGWPGTLTAGAVLGLHHQFYELAHYMKEDSAMLMGLALTFLAAAIYWQVPTRALAIFLGTACALAISGKYLGVLSLAFVLPVLLLRRIKGNAGFFLTGLFATLIVVNLPLLLNLDLFGKSFGREMGYVVDGQKGMTRNVPHSQYWSVFLDNSTPAIWVLLAVFLYARWRERLTLTPPEWAVILFPLLYTVILSFSPKSNDRYFLPASALFTLLAVLGIEDSAHLLAARVSRRVVLGAAALLLIVLQLTGWSHSRPGLLRYERAFQHDDLKELIAWIKENLPPTAVIVKDNRVGLTVAGNKKHRERLAEIPQKILVAKESKETREAKKEKEPKAKFAADFGSIEELRDKKGVTHVIVSETDYGRFFLKSLHPQEKEREIFERRKRFYEELFREGELMWEHERGTMIYLHPGLRVYRLRKPPLQNNAPPG